MEVILISMVVFSLAVLGLSIGVILNGKQIKGHCGGNLSIDTCIKDSQGNKIQSCPECNCEVESS